MTLDDDAPPPGPGGPGPEPGRRRRRWLPWLLAGSICLNLLLFGGVGGLLMRGWGPPPAEIPAGFDRSTLWRVYKGLEDADRAAVKSVLRGFRGRFREFSEGRRGARLAIAAALEAEPFSREALASAMAEARRRNGESRDLVDQAFAEFVSELSPATRAEIAEALREPRRRFRRDWDDDEDDDDE